MACLQTGENWYWKGSGNIRDKNLHPLDVNGVQDLRIENSAEECVKMTAQNKLEDASCTDNARKVCVMTYGGAGIGSSIGKNSSGGISDCSFTLKVIENRRLDLLQPCLGSPI